ncbi:restriction endonuclease subunit R [Zobellella taiwanensis]|uniref:Restriction endonuclease subunit R n=1 Tax=Zobellella taiwanensis TaxID=347535 RepID=A0A2P7R4C0_9GAMM|nr:DEAD/DEAH box helicase family protein [Zobellella taiwanensis]PSJ45066.1 restriction endonuclease subunit R [Zobellella taiwanensis]
MKLKFKVQPYQTQAVASVVDCFVGQPLSSNVNYRIDPGVSTNKHGQAGWNMSDQDGFKNADLVLSEQQLLENIHQVQSSQNLPLSPGLKVYQDHTGKTLPASYHPGSDINLDIEMETGTGKTYCYIKTIFELNQKYGWTKFIIVVPSIAIREGVYKSLQITSEHFAESYSKKARFFIYNSRQLHQLESFSSDSGINVMVINIQAFNASGKDNRRIYEELDDFQSRRPIDVISANRPILILDEPQKMEGKKTLDALAKFKPLMVLRYSATHKTTHHKVHRLDALDAYNQKLVKKIAVRGISVRGLAGTTAYLYLESIEISKKAPVARVDMEVRQGSGIKRVIKRLKLGDNLFDESNELEQYRGFVVSQIDANSDTVEFTNGHVLQAGEATGDVTEGTIRRIQIRETIRAHFEKEQVLHAQGIKVLSLFFIDEVAKYRDYEAQDDKGEYARIFEQEYQQIKDEYLSGLPLDNHAYRAYLEKITPDRTHNGYFSIDKKTKRLQDPSVKARGEDAGLSDDVDAYDLILKDKEKLLSFEEDTRFIFSHSALREGWDNPNVFVMCMLKHSDNTISRRQEVGRGLRLCVNQHGDRQDHPATVHNINVLSVIASESYKDFVGNLQREISESLSARPRKADVDYFTGKVMTTDQGKVEVTADMARQIYRYLLKNDYTDDNDAITPAYHSAKAEGSLAPLPAELEPYREQILTLIDGVFSTAAMPDIGDGRKPKTNPLNDNFQKKEFQALWARINKKAVYKVDFDSSELITNCIRVLDKELKVTPLQYIIQAGVQRDNLTDEQLKSGQGFELSNTQGEYHSASAYSGVKYDLVGKLATDTNLTRRTIAAILSKIQPAVFSQFKQNPEHFLAEATRLIKEQKASVIIEKLSYDETDDRYDTDIFTAAQSRQDFSLAGSQLKNHIYDYVITDSNIERDFVAELDTNPDVVVYAKLPRGFLIPTPVGDYNPDWAIAFKEGSVKHVYFIAETKGSLSTLELRGIEERKIDCARRFFDKISGQSPGENVKYDVVTNYNQLMDLVGGKVASER